MQRHWFEDLADHMGAAYLRYSFTRGTEQEVGFLIDVLGLQPGDRVLDVGCGPGRHANALAAAGMVVTGIDISRRFVEIASERAAPGASFVRADARRLSFDAEFDAAISLCQGAFGLGGPDLDAGDPANITSDEMVLRGMQRALVPGGRAAVSAFSSYFQVRFLEEGDHFDAATGINREHTTVLDEGGNSSEHDAWTTCYTPRELRLVFDRVGLRVDDVWSVTPGNYAARPPDTDHAEFLVLAHRPAVGCSKG
ncbi:MAG: Ubiquinone/menaquinone biosynthesis C-methyltransferase UbiE [Acidimicrobiales bacterium]|nr:Ubiquinone/menaquinone biosynthesis C-methyltransferase UbiE [Acidimicrobiales bacterium]